MAKPMKSTTLSTPTKRSVSSKAPIFNYYAVREAFKKEVGRFIVHECKKTRNADGSAQMRRYVLDFDTLGEEFTLFHRLISDATKELSRRRIYLPNPSDLFEGEDSFTLYRLGISRDSP